MRNAFIKILIDIAKNDKNVHLITGDLGYGVLQNFWEQLPEQFTNAGIAEQNMTGIAAGMALSGKNVFTYSIANFPSLRCIEQVRNDCAAHNANVKIVSIGAGFAYGTAGMTHHATEDMAIMRALPNVTVFSPADITETEYLTKAIYEHEGTCYLRLGKGGENRIYEKIDDFKIGKANKFCEGEKIVVFVTGSIFEEVLTARLILNDKKINPAIYTFPTVKPIDVETINECSKEYDLIVTVEEHNKNGGFGSAIAEQLAEISGTKAKMMRIAIDDTFAQIAGSQQYLRDYYGLSAEKIAEKIEKALNNI